MHRIAILGILLTFSPVYSLAHEANGKEADEKEDKKNLAGLLTITKAEASNPENCLNIRRFKSVKLLDDKHLLFMATGRAWLNEMPTACSSLNRAQILIFDRRVRRLCNNDSIRGLSPSTTTPTGHCTIGRFVEIEKSMGKRLLKAANNT